MKRARGFTLIELLVAISILAIVAVLGWRGLDGIVRARTHLTDDMETTRGMQLAFAQLQSDCERLVNPDQLQNRQYLATESDRLTMVRYVLVENEPTRLQVVSYRIRDGILTRRESIPTRDLSELDTLWQSSVSDSDPAPSVRLQAGVSGMVVRIWENGSWRVSTAPRMAGQVAPQGLLPVKSGPTGLEVALQVAGKETSMTKVFLLGGV